MDSYFSQANAFIANLVQMQPTLINFCIKSVESAVQNRINAMQIVAANCQNCSECVDIGFETSSFINRTCPLPEGVGGVLVSTFNRASSTLATLESAWQIYRDDTIQKTNYIIAKANIIFSKYSELDKILEEYRGKISFDFDKINIDVLRAYYWKIVTPLYWDFYYAIVNSNKYFMNQTDQLIVLSNQKMKAILISNWNNTDTDCRDGLLYQFYNTIFLTSYYWNFYMTSSFYVGDVDIELSAAFSGIYNFSLSVGDCVKSNSNNTILCLNQVKIF